MTTIKTLVGFSISFLLAASSLGATIVEPSLNFEVDLTTDELQFAAATPEQDQVFNDLAFLNFYDVMSYDSLYQVTKSSQTFFGLSLNSSIFGQLATVDSYQKLLPDTRVESIFTEQNFTATTDFAVGPLTLGSSTATVNLYSSEDALNADAMLAAFLDADPELGLADLVVHTSYTNPSSLSNQSLQVDAYYLNEDSSITVVQYVVASLDLGLPGFLLGIAKNFINSASQTDREAYFANLSSLLFDLQSEVVEDSTEEETEESEQTEELEEEVIEPVLEEESTEAEELTP